MSRRQNTWHRRCPGALAALLAFTLLIPGLSMPKIEAMTPTAPASAGSSFLHGPPAYDSGWVEVNANSSTAFYHNLGGNTDDYVVDVQFWDITESGGDVGVHNRGLGADFAEKVEGVYWQDLTDSSLLLVRTLSDPGAGAVRVRIWVVPDADYDSGWLHLDPGEQTTLTHNLGGDTNDYVVDVQFLSSNPSQGVNQLGLGGDDWSASRTEGAFWHNLDAMFIRVKRNADDASAADQVRIRIWRQPDADYDSGWQNITDVLNLTHALGGPWNDFVVDLQFNDTNGAWGVNQKGLGGDATSGFSPEEHGVYWTNLTANTVQVRRGADDLAAEQVRLRIWASRRPRYDSGWQSIGQGEGKMLTHSLGGTTYPYVVDVQFKDTDADGISGAGVNQWYYGGDTWYDHGEGQHVNSGLWWHSLNDESIFLYRFGNDHNADEVRVRLWIAPDADYDSGWQNIGSSLTLNHNLGGDPDDYVVDLQFNDNIAANPQGINQGRYGGDTFFENGTTSMGLGAYWQELNNSTITVQRLADADLVDAVRVRIWANKQFDYAGSWQSLTTVRTVHHDLDTCPDGLVVDLQFQSGGSEGVHQRGYGGNSIYFGRLYQYGAHWQALTSNTIELYRQADDGYVDQTRVRIWETPGCRIFLPLILRD